MQQRVERLDARYLNLKLMSELDGRTQVCLDLHRSSGHKILIHDTIRLRGTGHTLNDLLLELVRKGTVLFRGQLQKFIDDVRDHRADPGLLDQL